MRLTLLAIALALISFGIHPALEYRNAGALFMLGLAVFFVILALFLRPLLSLIRRTFLGKIIAIAFSLFSIIFIATQVLIFANGRPVDPLPRTDAIIVLGAGLTYGTENPSLVLSYRLNQALAYLDTYPGTPVIVSGGQGEIELISEATAMQQYLVKAGIPASQILLEDRSIDTLENLTFSAEITKENNFNTVAIITSDYHCLRAQLLASRIDLDATCIPAHNVWWLTPADNFREFLALTKIFLPNQ